MAAPIGDTITRQDGVRFRLSGMQGNAYVLQTLDGAFSAPELFTLEELLSGFDVDGVVQSETEAELLARLDAAANAEHYRYFGRGRRAKPALPPEGSPEARFAEQSAAAIIADAERLAAFEIGSLKVSPAVAAWVDEHIANRNAEEPVEPRRGRGRKDASA